MKPSNFQYMNFPYPVLLYIFLPMLMSTMSVRAFTQDTPSPQPVALEQTESPQAAETVPATGTSQSSPPPTATDTQTSVAVTEAEQGNAESVQPLSLPGVPGSDGWYVPTATDPQPIPVPTKLKRFYFMLGMELFFHSENLNNAPSPLSGAGGNFMVRFGGKLGFSVGFSGPGSHFITSFDLFRNQGKNVFHGTGFDIWILYPTVSAELLLVEKFDKFSFGVAGALTGIRFTFCEPTPLVIDLRAPTVRYFNDLPDAEGFYAIPIGFSLDAGILF